MKKLKKKIKPNRLSKNIVLFPGTIDILIARAHECVEKGQFEQANELFHEALQYFEGDELTLNVYSYSLYETKDYEKAKEICEKLLKIGPTMYFEVMELYLTICIQLKQFHQVEKLITTLLEEEKIPQEQIYKFKKLKELNANIAESKLMQDNSSNNAVQVEKFELNNFLTLSKNDQVKEIHLLASMNIRPIVPQLKQIVEHAYCHPFVKSMILILCVEQQVDIEMKVEKFGKVLDVNPSLLTVPTKMPQYLSILKMIEKQLDDNPTFLEMVESIMTKHAIVTFPFEWLDYEPEFVAKSYISYVETLFGNIIEIDDEFLQFIHYLEKLSQLHEE